MYRLLWYEYEYQHCITNPNTVLLVRPMLRKCDDSLVVDMMAKKSWYCRTEWYLLCYCCCVKHPAHPNSKSRFYPLRCQDSRTPTRSYTAAAAAVAVRCCCCCALGTRTHTRTVPLTSGWRYAYHVEGHTSRLRSKQALTSTVSQRQSADSEKHN